MASTSHISPSYVVLSTRACSCNKCIAAPSPAEKLAFNASANITTLAITPAMPSKRPSRRTRRPCCACRWSACVPSGVGSASSTEPDATGNTLKIAGTGKKWFLRDGDEVGCLFDLGPDPNGRTATTIAAPQGGGR